MFTQNHSRKLSVILISILFIISNAVPTINTTGLHVARGETLDNHYTGGIQVGVVLPGKDEPRWVSVNCFL